MTKDLELVIIFRTVESRPDNNLKFKGSQKWKNTGNQGYLQFYKTTVLGKFKVGLILTQGLQKTMTTGNLTHSSTR